MNTSTTVVRFRKDAAKHQRTGLPLGAWSDGAPRRIDKESDVVRILLPPVEPDWRWACDTRFVWRIADGEAERLTGVKPPLPIYVCEHQVEVD